MNELDLLKHFYSNWSFYDVESKIELLKRFYSSMYHDTIKLEVRDWGFDFINLISKAGGTLEYGELKGKIHKYKISNMPEKLFDYFLKHHVKQNANVCLYFNNKANNVFAFNLDNKNGESIHELKVIADIVDSYLRELGIEPLVYISGRGYHMWVRIDKPIDNKKIDEFMNKITARTIATLEYNNINQNKVDINIYPGKQTTKAYSLRLFGSKHIKNDTFSMICTRENGIIDLGENYFWIQFEDYLNTKTITVEQFEKALDMLSGHFDSIHKTD